MVGLLLLLSYVSVLVFLIAVVWRFVKISRLPLHLRWELYPVAHEKGRAHYGGSYLEESDWWTKPRHSSLIGELKVMIPEILLLAGVWEHNRKHWFRSFPFHFGLYLLAGLIGLLVVGGMAEAAGVAITAEGTAVAKVLYHATRFLGYAGLGVALLGTVALLARRMFEADYREYTKTADYINLAFFALTLAVALAAHTTADSSSAVLRDYVSRFLTLNMVSSEATVSLSAWSVAEIALGSVLLAYIPLTHMSHFFTKWFMYHDIRWNDEPTSAGGKIEQQIGEVLQYPVSWSASHIRGDGKKTWADVATSGVEESKEQ